jgi:hypothetical protein
VTPTTAEVLAVLRAIEAGDELVALADGRFDNMYSGDVPYDCSNGWTLIVFSDCGEWDYLDSVILPDGTRLGLWDFLDDPTYVPLSWGERAPHPADAYEEVRDYRPSREACRETWGLE